VLFVSFVVTFFVFARLPMLHVGDPRRYDRLPPVGKLLTLVFAMLGKDRGNWLRLDYHPDPPDVRMWYSVPTEVREMVPPPAHLWPDLYHTLWGHARLRRADRLSWWKRVRRKADFPFQLMVGVLPVRYGQSTCDFGITFFRGRTGQHIEIETQFPPGVSAVAHDFLRRRYCM
jgi:hypothetical protein